MTYRMSRQVSRLNLGIIRHHRVGESGANRIVYPTLAVDGNHGHVTLEPRKNRDLYYETDLYYKLRITDYLTDPITVPRPKVT